MWLGSRRYSRRDATRMRGGRCRRRWLRKLRSTRRWSQNSTGCTHVKWGGTGYATFWTLLERMQDVQTRMRFPAPLMRARTDWRLMFQRRLVTLCAWLILLPYLGPRPHISQTCAIDRILPRFDSRL